MYSDQMFAWIETAAANRLEVSTLMMAWVISHLRLNLEVWVGLGCSSILTLAQTERTSLIRLHEGATCRVKGFDSEERHN